MTGFDQANQSEQLKMFMTPREIMDNYGPRDSERWITATHQPDGIGTMGDQTSQPPLWLATRPEEFGIIRPYSQPEFEGRKEADAYAERWYQSKEKFDRGEGNDPEGGDMYYEAGDPAPGTREYTEFHSTHTEGWTDREDYLDTWMGYGGVGSIKEEMAAEAFTGSVDDYIDQGESEYYEYTTSQKRYNLEKDNDPSTWFEDDPQYWKRTLEHAKQPTPELASAARAEGELEQMDPLPKGLGAFARGEGMGVEDPVTLGTTPEVNVRGQVTRPIWEGQHDLISAYNQKPDDLIPVQHTGRTGSYGSYADAFLPHADRQKGAEAVINDEQSRINVESHMDSMAGHIVDDDRLSKEFYVTRPNSDPAQTKAF